MRTHTPDEAQAVIDTVEQWQEIALRALGRRLVYAADEYYLIAGRPFPVSERYDGFPQHENGIGMARAFAAAFAGDEGAAFGVKPGFFAWVDGAPAAGYRAVRSPGNGAAPTPGPDRAASGDETALGRDRAPVAVITGEYGAMVLGPLLAPLDVRLLPVHNAFFGGNIAVTGLLTGVDIARALSHQPVGHRYLLPDVCLSEGRFLDGMTPAELPRPVEIVPTDGLSLRHALEARPDEVGATATQNATHAASHGAPVPVALGQSR